MPVTSNSVAAAPAKDSSRDAWRRKRFDAQHVLWRESSLKRVRKCGHAPVDARGVGVRVTRTPQGSKAGFSGLATCGSVWACPECANKVLGGRQGEIEKALSGWTAGGGKIGLLTLTMRHKSSHKLAPQWDGLSKAWGTVTSGSAWENQKTGQQARYGTPLARVVTKGKRKGQTVVEKRVPWIRVVEVTHGANGWHVHVHVALFLPAWAGPKDVDDLGCEMFQRWRDALVGQGLMAPQARRGGLDAQLWDGTKGALSNYFTKNEYAADAGKAAVELARGDAKAGRSGNRTPFQILEGCVETVTNGVLVDGHDFDAELRLWHEWERASKGRRHCTWSVGLKARFDIAEVEDQEHAEAELGGETEILLPADTYGAIRRGRLRAVFLELVETSLPMAENWLDERELVWFRPPPDGMGAGRPPRE